MALVKGKATAWLLPRAVFAFLLMAAISWSGLDKAQAQTGCVAGACVSVGPRLVSVNTTQAALLNPILQALLPGTSVNLNVADWNALATSDINLNALITQLQSDLSLSTPAEVLSTELTLGQLQAAMASVLQADGQTAAANVLQLLPLNVPGLIGTIRLQELLQIDLPTGSLADIQLDVLDLVTGFVQLYNFSNVLTTPAPITLNTGALGLTGVANVQIWVQVIEPPVYVCSDVGGQFYTAAVRLKLNADVLDGINLQALLNALNGLGVTNLTLANQVLHLQLYADIARAEGTVGAVDAIAQTVTLDVEPGIADLYIGQIADSVFFNRNQVLSPALFSPLQLTSLDVQLDVNVLGVGLVHVQVPMAITAKAAAEGDPGVETVVFNGPFPQTITVDSGTISAGNLLTSLLSNLDVQVTAGLVNTTLLGLPIPNLLQAAVNLVVNPIINLLVNTLETTAVVLQPVLNTLLGGVVDPLLDLLGIGIGEAVVTTEGIARECVATLSLAKQLAPASDAGRFDLSISQSGTLLATANAVGNGGSTAAVTTTPGSSYELAETAAGATLLGIYDSSWQCMDQDNNVIGSGTGTSFSIEAPPASPDPTAIVCTLSNSLRQANMSISKSDGSASYSPGGNAIYVITVANAGPAAVVGAVVNDSLPAGATLGSAWTCAVTQGAGTCTPASGGSAGATAVSLTVDLQAGATAEISVPVSFSADPADYQ